MKYLMWPCLHTTNKCWHDGIQSESQTHSVFDLTSVSQHLANLFSGVSACFSLRTLPSRERQKPEIFGRCAWTRCDLALPISGKCIDWGHVCAQTLSKLGNRSIKHIQMVFVAPSTHPSNTIPLDNPFKMDPELSDSLPNYSHTNFERWFYLFPSSFLWLNSLIVFDVLDVYEYTVFLGVIFCFTSGNG